MVRDITQADVISGLSSGDSQQSFPFAMRRAKAQLIPASLPVTPGLTEPQKRSPLCGLLQ